MTCIEKLKLEHPESTGDQFHAGCANCPSTYGYLDDPAGCNTAKITCEACWDREIPEEKCEAVEQEKTHSYIRFVDGHSEEITWYDKPSEDTVFATTESGRYQYYDDGCIPKFGKFNAQKICYETVQDIEYIVVGDGRFEIKPRKFNTQYYDDTRDFGTMSELTKDDVLESSDKTIGELTEESLSGAHIKDSGDRTEFATGAVRDMREGKGRCDLMPLMEVGHILNNVTLCYISKFQEMNDVCYLRQALTSSGVFHDPYTMFLEVAKHFEEGCKKYGENNWRKGIDVKFYIDSAVRHYLKFLRGDKDEPHDRAFCWNILCCIWTAVNKPELSTYAKEKNE